MGEIDDNDQGMTASTSSTSSKGCKRIMVEACGNASLLGFNQTESPAAPFGADYNKWKIGVAAACDYHSCVFGSDYLSDDFLDRPIEVDEPSCLASSLLGQDFGLLAFSYTREGCEPESYQYERLVGGMMHLRQPSTTL